MTDDQKEDSNAHYYLAMAYKNGTPEIPCNYRESERLLRLAADKKHMGALMELAREYLYGMNVVQDSCEAARLYYEAACSGNTDAQFELGTMYMIGNGVPKSLDDMVFWWRKAALLSNTMAHSALLRYYTGLRDSPTLLALAHLYYGNISTRHFAIPTLRSAATLGNIAAQYELGVLLFDKKEFEEGMEWLRRTAHVNYKDSKKVLELVYDMLSDAESDTSFDGSP